MYRPPYLAASRLPALALAKRSNNRQVPHVVITAAHPVLPHNLSLSAAASPQRLPAYIFCGASQTTHRSCYPLINME